MTVDETEAFSAVEMLSGALFPWRLRVADAVGVNALLVRISWFLLSAILRKMSPSRSLPEPNAGMPFIDDNGNAVYSMKRRILPDM